MIFFIYNKFNQPDNTFRKNLRQSLSGVVGYALIWGTKEIQLIKLSHLLFFVIIHPNELTHVFIFVAHNLITTHESQITRHSDSSRDSP